jgi:hypothetical protein
MLPVSEYARVRKAIVSGSSVALKTSNYSATHRDHVDRVLSLYLYELGLVHLHNNLAYCVHELAGNARNALLKRIWFSEHGLDLADRATYSASVAEFRRTMSADPQRYLAVLESSQYHIRFILAHNPDQIWITVENNTPLLTIERERIEAKLAAARDYQSMADAYGAMIDFSEGAGLGLAMVVIMLRTLGLSPDSLIVGGCSVDERVTRSAIIIDRSEVGRIRGTREEERVIQ